MKTGRPQSPELMKYSYAWGHAASTTLMSIRGPVGIQKAIPRRPAEITWRRLITETAAGAANRCVFRASKAPTSQVSWSPRAKVLITPLSASGYSSMSGFVTGEIQKCLRRPVTSVANTMGDSQNSQKLMADRFTRSTARLPIPSWQHSQRLTSRLKTCWIEPTSRRETRFLSLGLLVVSGRHWCNSRTGEVRFPLLCAAPKKPSR